MRVHFLTAETFLGVEKENQFASSKPAAENKMIKFLALFAFFGFSTSDPVSIGKCMIVKGTTLSCLEAEAEDLPKVENNEIEWIMFTKSRVPVLKKQHLGNYPSLTDLHMKNTQLEKIEHDAFSSSKSLSWVDVSLNRLTTISPNLFQGCPEVYYFNISNNPNLVIPKNEPFLNAPQLKWLVIQNSGVKELYPETFSKVQGLKYLSLSDNELTTLPGNILQPLKRLTSLDLSRNNFKSLNIETDIFRTMALYLSDNPWECDCSLFPTIEWAKKNSIRDDVRCSKPDNKKWQEVSNMNCPQIAAH